MLSFFFNECFIFLKRLLLRNTLGLLSHLMRRREEDSSYWRIKKKKLYMLSSAPPSLIRSQPQNSKVPVGSLALGNCGQGLSFIQVFLNLSQQCFAMFPCADLKYLVFVVLLQLVNSFKLFVAVCRNTIDIYILDLYPIFINLFLI